jgi:hypothetical protein
MASYMSREIYVLSTMSATFALTKIPIDDGVVRVTDVGRGHSGMPDNISVSWRTEKAESYVHHYIYSV